MYKLETFLLLGGYPGNYRASQFVFDVHSTESVRTVLRAEGVRAVQTIAAIADSGSAISHDASLFALALASSPEFADAGTNIAALQALPQVARTGAHLCKYAAYVGGVRGWGRGLRSAVADWYISKPVGELATQILKHRQRKGWSHRDLLRLSHPKPPTPAHNALFQWAVEGQLGHLAPANIARSELRQIYAFEQLKKTSDETEMVRFIEDYRLTHETIPAQCRKSAAVWEALLGSMPYMAMVRNLGHMTEAGLIAPQNAATALIVARLIDRSRIRRAKVHPAALLSALLRYRKGPWTASELVASALEDAFHFAFDNVESTGKRVSIGIDSSLLGGEAACNGMPHISAAMAAAALAMEFARVDSYANISVLQDRPVYVDISKDHRLTPVCQTIVQQPVSGDPSILIEHALSNGLQVDAFVFVSGRLPLQAFENYRQRTGTAAKLVLVAPSASGFEDVLLNENILRIAGFDSTVPRVIRQFIGMAELAAIA